MNTVRIFLSSPGDVAQERRISGRVIERLDAEFPNAKLEPYFWEYEPMRITKDYQEQIPPPSSFDIVICILWSRMGSRMHTKYQRDDGTPFRSGTEYEFVDAVEGQKRNDGTPDVLVWINKTQPLIPLEPEAEHEERLRQWRELKSFLEEWTRDGDEGTFKGAVNRYARLDEFEEKLEAKMRKLILEKLDGGVGESGPGRAEITWTKGSPFRGLEPFFFEHAGVFFGRTAPVAAAIDALRRQRHERGSSFLMVAGASGSGKSSLARAGVMPMLVEPGVMEGIGLWRRASMHPSGAGNDPFTALAIALLAEEALPELAAQGMDAAELATILRERPGEAIGLGRGALAQAAALVHADEKQRLAELVKELGSSGRSEDAKATEKLLEKLEPPQAQLALLIDQFEELFDSDVSAADREAFIALASELAGGGRVFVIATLRSDFLPHCAEFPGLLELTRGDGMLHLGAPEPAELGQMIRQPAQAAGLHFEIDAGTGEALDEVLRDAAVEQPTVLPLLEFCLNELYERRGPNGELTFESYNELGGVEGALAKRAEEVFASLPPQCQEALPALARSLVTLGGSGEEETATRRRALRERLDADPATKELTDALIAARLCVADADERGRPTVSVAHEALLRCWPRLREAIEDDRDFLRARARVSASAKRWQSESRDAGFLLPAGRQLAEAEGLLEQRAGELGADERKFIEASANAFRQKRDRRLRIQRWLTAAGFTLAIGALIGAIFGFAGQGKAKRQAEVAEEEAARADEQAEQAEAAKSETMDMLVDTDITISSYQANPTGHSFLARAVRNDPDHRLAATFLYSKLLNEQFMMPLAKSMDSGNNALCEYSRNGRRLLTYRPELASLAFGKKGVARVWDPETGELIVEIPKKGVTTAKISPDGEVVAAAYEPGGVQLFDASDGKALGDPLPDTEFASDIEFEREGSRMMVVSQEGITMWDTKTLARQGPKITSDLLEEAWVFYSPDGGSILFLTEFGIEVFDAGTGQRFFEPVAADIVINYVQFNTDGSEIFVCSDDGRVLRYDSKSGEEIGQTLQHGMPVISCQVSPRGTSVVILDQNHQLSLWDLESGTRFGTPMGFNGNISEYRYAPDGQRVFLTTEAGEGYLVSLIYSRRDAYPLNPMVSVSSFAMDPIRQRVAFTTASGITTLHSTKLSQRPSLRYTFVLQSYPVFSRDGAQIASVDQDGTVRANGVLDGKVIGTPIRVAQIVETLAFSGDKSRLAIGFADGSIGAWNIAQGTALGLDKSIAPESPISVDLNNDGSKLIAATSTGSAFGWETESGEPLWPKRKIGMLASEIGFLPGDAEFITSGFSFGSDIHISDSATGERLDKNFTFENGKIALFQFGRDRSILYGFGPDGLTAWNTETRDLITVSPGLTNTTSVASLSDGSLVVSIGSSNFAKVVDPMTGAGLVNLNVSSFLEWPRFDPGGRFLAAASYGQLRVWEVLPGEPFGDSVQLAELIELLGGIRVERETNRSMVIPHDERVRRLAELRETAQADTPEGRITSWILDDPWTRKISPSAQINVREHILRDCAVPAPMLEASMFELGYNYQGHPLVYAAIAELFRDQLPDLASWGRKIAKQNGETVAGFCYELSAYLAEQKRFEEAAHYLQRATEEGFPDQAKLNALGEQIQKGGGG